MIWGIGAALTEENHVDLRYGSFISGPGELPCSVNADKVLVGRNQLHT